MGLHPWEFYEYTMQEYIQRRTGMIERDKVNRRQDFQHIRYLAFHMIAPYLNHAQKSKSIDELVPDIYKETENKKTKSVEEILQMYRDANILQPTTS